MGGHKAMAARGHQGLEEAGEASRQPPYLPTLTVDVTVKESIFLVLRPQSVVSGYRSPKTLTSLQGGPWCWMAAV